MPAAQQVSHARINRRSILRVHVKDRPSDIAPRDRSRFRNPGRRVPFEIACPEIPILAVDHSEQEVASRLVNVGERRIEIVKVRFHPVEARAGLATVRA